jgi:hypothetical protein
VEKLAKDKRSSLLQKILTYDRKKFYNIDHRRHLASPMISSLSCGASSPTQSQVSVFSKRFFSVADDATTKHSRNTLAYFHGAKVMKKKAFIIFPPCVNVIKLFSLLALQAD